MAPGQEAFIARIAGSSEQYGVLTTGVGEKADGAGASLLFMSPLPDDADTTMRVCNEHGAVASGGVSEIWLGRTTLRVLFAPGVGAGLGYPDETVITLALDAQQRASLREGLAAVVGRCSDPPRLVVEDSSDDPTPE